MAESNNPVRPLDPDRDKMRDRILRGALKGGSERKELSRRIFKTLYERWASGNDEPIRQSFLAPHVGLETTKEQLVKLRQAVAALRAVLLKYYLNHPYDAVVFEIPEGEYRLLVTHQRPAKCDVHEQGPSDAPEDTPGTIS